ncbi:hypothetical protein ROZALSC1DRAFT_28764 [Rozella allomycis CSF55]|uniref:Ras modification protein ERF4 n=1 Tax=Rozella allomycis (strain CSF55) TaxID=988480 RepID=A0A4P9YJ99_ROZAC|nr:hypothetical protein ROZALSC1DRAFT_28764 [Rozella allomycis CSF55]
MKDFYRVLNIDFEAATHEIKKAYQEKLLKIHPDKTGIYNGTVAMEIEELKEALSTLSDSKKRHLYNSKLRTYYSRNEVIYTTFTIDEYVNDESVGYCRCSGSFVVDVPDCYDLFASGLSELIVPCDSCSLHCSIRKKYIVIPRCYVQSGDEVQFSVKLPLIYSGMFPYENELTDFIVELNSALKLITSDHFENVIYSILSFLTFHLSSLIINSRTDRFLYRIDEIVSRWNKMCFASKGYKILNPKIHGFCHLVIEKMEEKLNNSQSGVPNLHDETKEFPLSVLENPQHEDKRGEVSETELEKKIEENGLDTNQKEVLPNDHDENAKCEESEKQVNLELDTIHENQSNLDERLQVDVKENEVNVNEDSLSPVHQVNNTDQGQIDLITEEVTGLSYRKGEKENEYDSNVKNIFEQNS